MPSMGHLYRWSVFRAKSQNNEKSNTELELFELAIFVIVSQKRTHKYLYYRISPQAVIF